jgi:hypothetical protein
MRGLGLLPSRAIDPEKLGGNQHSGDSDQRSL